MKKIVICTLLALTTIGSIAQGSCSKYYPFSEGTSTQLTMYDKKGKLSVVVEYTVASVASTSEGETATMSHKLIDDKGNLISTSEYEVLCKDGLVSIDFNSLTRPEMMQAFGGNAETEVTGTNIDLPNNLSVGQELPDGGINISIKMSGMNMNMTTTITDRKVIGKESVTTPAGTFECYVITATTTMKMGANMTRSSKQWISEGVGVVKMEDYDKKGKLESTGLLTAFSK